MRPIGPAITAIAIVLVLTTTGCQSFAPAPGVDGGAPPWFARAGVGGWVPEIGSGLQPAGTTSVGRRLSAPWFVEAQVANPRWEREYERDGMVYDCEGHLLVYTLQAGREYIPFGDPKLRLRAHLGAGYFRAHGLRQDDDGLATTAGAALQFQMTDDLWTQLGVTHVGLFSELDRSDRTYRHNLLVDVSLVLDF